MKQTIFRHGFALLLAMVLLCAGLPAARADFSVDAQAAVVMELESGIILYQQYADITVYPASLTKVMTALVAVEHCSLDEMFTVHGEVLENLHPDSTTAQLVDGEVLSLRDLLYCMFLVSANDASCVIAENVAGTVDAFVEMMNDKAAELGCTGTHFANPHGLHEENHYTTALDLLRMAEAFYRNETLMEIAETEYYDIAATAQNNRHEMYTIIHTNSTAITPAYYYEGCRGIKTGSTSAAGRCLMVFCEREELKVLAVVTGCPSYVTRNGSDGWAGHFAAMHDLLDYTYANFDMAVLREAYAEEIAARVGQWESQPMPELPLREPELPEPTEPDEPKTPPTDLPVEPSEPTEPVVSPDEPAAPEESAPMPWYGKLLLGLAVLLLLYTIGYLVHNLTRPVRRRRRQDGLSQREE